MKNVSFDPSLFRTPVTKDGLFRIDVHPDGQEQKWRDQWKLVKLRRSSPENPSWMIGKKGNLKGCLHIMYVRGQFSVGYYAERPNSVVRQWGCPDVTPTKLMDLDEVGQFLRKTEVQWADEIEGIIPSDCPVCKTAYDTCHNCGVVHY